MAKIQYNQKIMEKESLQRISQIEDEMHLARQKSHANAESYKLKQQADVNKLLHTPQYIELKKFDALAQNTKVYFGNDIPQTFLSSDCAAKMLSTNNEQDQPSHIEENAV